MHDIQFIRDDPNGFLEQIKTRGVTLDLDILLDLDISKRAKMSLLQESQNERRVLSEEIGKLKSIGDNDQADKNIKKVHSLKEKISNLEDEIHYLDKKLNSILMSIPNLPSMDVPIGKDESHNLEVIEKRYRQDLITNKAEHFEISGIENLMDFQTAAKVSGARFVYLKGQLANLERALGQFMLDTHVTENGYTEISPPIIVNNNSMVGTAQLPKFEEDQFQVITHGYDNNHDDNKKWLIPTAEVPLTNIIRESILEKKDLPLRFVALTQCFRAEAGAAGRDTRGMIRQHQFQKVELVSVTEPELSEGEHERMLSCAELVLKKLDIPYRVMILSTGDMGFSAKKTYDIEVWMPGQGTYREISSISNCGDFQARRMMARYKQDQKNTRYLHTLNGSGVAVGRALIAILENYQIDGGIEVPSVLRKYMNDIKKIEIS
jgi:seryl-tRNA synthetase